MPQLGSGPTSDNQGSGFYSKADYIDLVRYAKARGVTVIPEINMPAHARAAVVSMEARYKRLMSEVKRPRPTSSV
jgi:hexosaminidase